MFVNGVLRLEVAAFGRVLRNGSLCASMVEVTVRIVDRFVLRRSGPSENGREDHVG